MKRGLSWYATLGLVLVLLGGALGFQRRMIRNFYNDPEKFRDSLYVPSPGYLKTITVGYDQFFAEFFWLRMIQGFAAGWSRPETAEQMYSYFQGITELDPHFLEVYLFSFMPLGEDGNRNDLVKKVVMKSYYYVPGNWKVTSNGAAYFGMTQKRDVDLAKFYLRLMLLSPDHPNYMDNWMGYFEFQEGRFKAAYEKYLTDYIQSFADGPNDLTAIRRVHISRNVDGWFKDAIGNRAADYIKAHDGQIPTFQQLKDSGAFNGVELPDWGKLRALLDKLENSGKVPPLPEDEAHQIVESFIKKWDAYPPESPFDYQLPGFSGYAIIPTPGKPALFEILSMKELLTRYQIWSRNFDDAAQAYKQAHNGECPAKITDVFHDIPDGFKDPLGGQIEIDPATCKLKFTSVPKLDDMLIFQ